jgi:hypothetical protein
VNVHFSHESLPEGRLDTVGMRATRLSMILYSKAGSEKLF